MTRTLIALFLSAGFAFAQDPPELSIHEWGTFTSLQDEDGNAIGGINTDDEPVPKFVHQLSGRLLIPPSELAPVYFKGTPRCHPHVTLRLETPVIYFHPPDGASLPLTLDLQATLRGGWLTEFFPEADVSTPGVDAGAFTFSKITERTRGSLAWRNLGVGTRGRGPETRDPVWTAPRNVSAATVTAEGGESERFLFYRGVARLDAPLTIRRHANDLAIHARVDGSSEVPKLWLVDVRRDGASAFREFGPLKTTPLREATLARVPAAFPRGAYRPENTLALRRSMRPALVRDGLNPDEADALLNTWQVSYFRSPGLRLFFIVPKVWTERVLPLESSVPARFRRVFVGRIELVTPEHRKLLGKIAAGPASSPDWMSKWYQKDPSAAADMTRVYRTGTFRGTSAPIPEDYRAYLHLGRLRNALVLDELKRRPTRALRAFISNYSLHSFRIARRDSRPATSPSASGSR